MPDVCPHGLIGGPCVLCAVEARYRAEVAALTAERDRGRKARDDHYATLLQVVTERDKARAGIAARDELIRALAKGAFIGGLVGDGSERIEPADYVHLSAAAASLLREILNVTP